MLLIREFISFFALQFCAYIILVANIRAIAHTHYTYAASTEFFYLILQWTILRRVVQADTLTAKAGYIMGGVIGGWVSMWLTRTWAS